jgi:hypothetical protein
MKARYGAIKGVSPKVKIPLLSTDVPVQWAIPAFAVLGLGIAAWVSHILWSERRRPEGRIEGFWLGLSSLSRFREGGFNRAVSILEILIAAPAALALMITPLAMGVLAIGETWVHGDPWYRSFLITVSISSLICSLSSLYNYINLIKRGSAPVTTSNASLQVPG